MDEEQRFPEGLGILVSVPSPCLAKSQMITHRDEVVQGKSKTDRLPAGWRNFSFIIVASCQHRTSWLNVVRRDAAKDAEEMVHDDFSFGRYWLTGLCTQ